MGRGGGKKQHSKDKMYMLQSEWQYEGGGFKGNRGALAAKNPYRKLPFHCCALSLAPFQDPMMTPKGIVYDMLNIIPYVSKHKRCPVTGESLQLKELTKLHFYKNDKEEYHCPVMFKTFTPHTYIVAIKTTGNVYCYDAVETLCYKTKNYKDLINEVPFTKKDVIVLQDPHNFENREIDKFAYIRDQSNEKEDKVAEMQVNDETRRILEKAGLAKPGEGGNKRASAPLLPPEPKKPKTEDGPEVKRVKGVSSGAMAASFTSTAVEVATKIEEKAMTSKEKNLERWSIMRSLGKKGYVQMKTSHGDLNLEIRCDIAPATSENFLTLCSRGYYNGIKFHRVIKNFMMQGGDPTGTGKGGESCWGGKFDDEFDVRLRHSGRGMLSMANSGTNTNGSQFFITFKSCTHLDNKHAVFGSVVGGLQTLDKVEKVPVGAEDRPKEEVVILEVVVFVNPYENDLPAYFEEQKQKEKDQELEKAKLKKQEQEDKEEIRGWYTNPAAQAVSKKEVHKSSGVGRYIAPTAYDRKEGGVEEKQAQDEDDIWANAVPVVKPKIQPKSGFGNFSNW